MTELLVDRGDVAVYHAEWRELLAALPRREDGTVCDLLCVDAPYSERTHGGHADGIADVEATEKWAKARGLVNRRANRRAINYAHWSADDVHAFVRAWAPVTRGWVVSITDHVLAASWLAAMEEAGRYTFSPLAYMAVGSRPRLSGDGPSQWSTWLTIGTPFGEEPCAQIAVSRPRTREAQRWGTLPGGYVLPPGYAERMPVVGGKPLWLCERLIEDYSRPGDIVCDPCCGGGTALEAALRTGRRAVGGDQMREHAEMSAARVSRPVQRPLFLEAP